jgi:hypothetical protein
MRSVRALLAVLVVMSIVCAPARADPVVAAAGDIACDPGDPGYNGGAGSADRCRQRATSDLLVAGGLDAVLPLGDIQYDSASLANINAVYDPTWGRVKAISHPIMGNHEGSGTGYFDYFDGPGAADGPAGPRGKGYYSFDLGFWHLVALNSECDAVPCSAGSEQEQWLRADLAAHPTTCTLAYWHKPRWSSGHDGNNTFMQPLWAALDEAGVEILLSGHSHDYERFTPLDAAGMPDPAGGVRQFVVGTGGAFFTGIGSTIPYSEVAQNSTFGVLKLTLHPSSYDWAFVPEAGKAFTDAGSQACHGPVAPAPAPPVDATAPVISRLTLKPRRFRTGGRGARFRYRLTEAATVKFTVKRSVKGRSRYRRVGDFVQAGVAGANSRRFRAKLGRRRLRPGSFRAVLQATDTAGNRSGLRKVDFRVLRRTR